MPSWAGGTPQFHLLQDAIARRGRPWTILAPEIGCLRLRQDPPNARRAGIRRHLRARIEARAEGAGRRKFPSRRKQPSVRSARVLGACRWLARQRLSALWRPRAFV